MTEHRKCCGTCEWFDKTGIAQADIGSCVVNPPVAVPMQIPQQVSNPKSLINPRAAPTEIQMVTQLQGVFPPTHVNRRCGKWSLNPELKTNGHKDRLAAILPAAGTFRAAD